MLKGLRLADVAKIARCSESLLSKVENDKASPSLSLLHRLAAALDTNIAWIFTFEDETPGIVMRRSERPLIKFPEFRKTEGTQVERFAPYFEGQLLQGSLFIVAPGGKSLDDIEHEGEEIGYILEGRIELTVDGETFLLEEGDSFQFRSERPHGYRNPGSEPARILWINTPRTY